MCSQIDTSNFQCQEVVSLETTGLKGCVSSEAYRISLQTLQQGFILFNPPLRGTAAHLSHALLLVGAIEIKQRLGKKSHRSLIGKISPCVLNCVSVQRSTIYEGSISNVWIRRAGKESICCITVSCFGTASTLYGSKFWRLVCNSHNKTPSNCLTHQYSYLQHDKNSPRV